MYTGEIILSSHPNKHLKNMFQKLSKFFHLKHRSKIRIAVLSLTHILTLKFFEMTAQELCVYMYIHSLGQFNLIHRDSKDAGWERLAICMKSSSELRST